MRIDTKMVGDKVRDEVITPDPIRRIIPYNYSMVSRIGSSISMVGGDEPLVTNRVYDGRISGRS